MTKKDYVLLARVLCESKDYDDYPHVTTRRIALDIADALERENPRFNRERFLKACGVQSDE